MNANVRIRKLRQIVRLLNELQNDINRHTRAWYPIFTRAGGDPRTMFQQLSVWINRLSLLAETAVDLQRAKEEESGVAP